jgi:hypothetical protein
LPFVSGKQERWMYQNHPDIAKRWTAEFGSTKQRQNFKPSPSSESNETPKLGQPTLPRRPEVKRDFGPLHPSTKARLKTSSQASTKESDEEDAVEAHHLDGRKEKMSLKGNKVLDPFAKRDSKISIRKA